MKKVWIKKRKRNLQSLNSLKQKKARKIIIKCKPNNNMMKNMMKNNFREEKAKKARNNKMMQGNQKMTLAFMASN